MEGAENFLQKKQWNIQTIFLEHFLTDWPATNVTRLAIAPTENFTQPEKSLNENWSNLSEVIKADSLFVQCLVKVQNISIQQAFRRLATIKQVLHRLLPFHKGGDLTAIWQSLLLNQQQELITDLSIRKYVSNNPESDYQEAFNYSLPLLKQQTVASPSIVELRLYYLKDILDSWVDWQRAKIQLLNPYQILSAVMTQYGRPSLNEFFQPPFDIDQFPNIRFLDEAALLWKQLQKGDMFQGVVENGAFSFSLLEDQFFHALSTAYQRQKIMDKMFLQEEMHNNSKAIYFNGIALKNAQGKLLNDFINCTELEEISDYSALSSLERRSLLQEKFHQIGESEQYEIGSLLHSLASSLQRIYYYQFSALPLHNSQKQLLGLFKHSEEQWVKRKNYPIQPRLLLALHFAESNNVTFFDIDWKINVKKLFKYLANEFEKIILNPPSRFNRVKAAIDILQTQGMSLQEVKQERYYVIDADDAKLSRTYFGTPLEQFLKTADWDGVIGKAMYHKSRKIEPRKALQQAEEYFNSQLYKDPWVQNKAIDNLKHAEREVTAKAVGQEVKRIVADYETETENHRAWIRGLKTWINIIPIVGPLYTIEEGIRDKDPVEVLCGVFFLSLDALDLLAAEGRPEAIELPVRERVTINTIQTSFKKLNLSPADLPLEDKIYITSDPFSISHINELPAVYEFNAELVRAGRQDLTLHEYPLVYLADENRVVPVKAEGGSFREINWHTLEVDPKKHLIFKDRESGKYFSRSAGLKGGNSAEVEFTKEELRQRTTVKETEEIFKTADDYIQYNFKALFDRCFYIKKFLSASVFDLRQFYRSVYQTSSTFRRIFNRFHEVFISEHTDKLWEIRIKPNTITRTDFESNVIHIGADAEIAAKTYFSSKNNFEISHPEQVYLHEMLHALTGKKDPLKIVDIRHRGPIVYLTDKILSEAGYAFPQRIMYRRLVPSDADLEGFELRCKQHREAEKLLVAQENQYLDNFIDNGLPIDEYKKVFGEELSARYTIQELNGFSERFLSKSEVSTKVSFEERFLARFSAKTMDWLLEFYVNLYIKSDTFYHLFEHWYGQLPALEKRWYFELSDSTARAELPVNKQAHSISDLSKKIYIFNDDTLYLTDKGLLPVERTRQLVHEMVQILTEFKDPPADIALKNRGAVVVITDKILNEAIYELDKRLVYGLAKSGDVARQAALLSYQLEASRAVILEDRLLKNIPIFQEGCTGCRVKRSLPERRYLSKMFNSNPSIQQKDSVNEKKKIQANLKKYGITQALNYLNAENFNLTHNSNIGSSFFYKSAWTSNYNISATNASFFLK